MARSLRNPRWIDRRLLSTDKLEELSGSFLEEIRNSLSRFQSENPLVSIVIPAFNEEFTIIRTLQSLSRNETNYPVEIIVVNNNSTDRTQTVLDMLNVKSVFQPVPGWGAARQAGLENAKGKYILSADADSFYPTGWIQTMTTALLNERVACVYGGFSYLGSAAYPRWKFFAYETFRDIIRTMRHIRRPHFNARGLSMGYPRELALRKGYDCRKVKGEDGRMCFELMQYGTVARVSSDAAQVWTLPRYLKADGGLLFSFLNHGMLELKRFKNYFRPFPIHDTHISKNSQAPGFQSAGKKTAAEKPVATKPGIDIDPVMVLKIEKNPIVESRMEQKPDAIGEAVD